MSFEPFKYQCDRCPYIDMDGTCINGDTCPRCGKGKMRERNPKFSPQS